MKSIVCMVLLAMMACNIVAQYSQMSEKQLLAMRAQAKKSASTGKGLILFGSMGVVTGGILYFTGLKQIMEAETVEEINAKLTKSMIGIGVGLAGGIMLGVGVPVAAVNCNKLKKIDIYLMKYDNQAYVPSVGVRFTF
jgi:hypothetical protein